jgi:hypothetical protein
MPIQYPNLIQDRYTLVKMREIIDVVNRIKPTVESHAVLLETPIPSYAKIQQALSAGGTNPLNVGGLVGSTPLGLGGAMLGVHAARPNATGLPEGTLYYETDRTAFYIIQNFGGSKTWTYASGMMTGIRTAAPTDLAAGDVGFLYNVDDYIHLVRWSGVAWNLVDAVGGYFLDSAIVRGTGYQLCDGTVTDYLLDGTTNLAVQPFTTPDETGTFPGTHHVSIAAYTGVINLPTSPTISLNTATALTGLVPNKILDNVPSGGPDTVWDTASTITDPGHLHAISGNVTLAGDPTTTMGVLRYFRR